MFGRLAAARFNQQSLAHIEPQFHYTASTCEAVAGAASPDRPKNKSAVDSVVLSLIPFAIVACVVVGGLFGAGFVMIVASEENIVAQTVRKPEATVTSRTQTALPSEVTATPPPTPTSSLREATPSLLPEQTHRLDKATLVTPPGQIFSPREAPTIPTEQTASAEVVVHDSSASPASNLVSENSRQKQHEARIRFLREQVARSGQQLVRPHLSTAETKRFERQKAYWDRVLQRTSAAP